MTRGDNASSRDIAAGWGHRQTGVIGAPVTGMLKDVAMLGGYQEMEVDFTADNFGLAQFHCHMQRPMDHGFMALFDSA